ncbi:unnamed protein product [Notodromas monacha]|uniref:Uncharacterized protein n=1 Tax=Notodromas monacha TaxID=399045 RepID=A0A7R9BL53_9CRUS|nr:unnamed protein product [Notodromas monacha]CAG0916181.1 unnamed protein product [Notodromas monacha]
MKVEKAYKEWKDAADLAYKSEQEKQREKAKLDALAKKQEEERKKINCKKAFEAWKAEKAVKQKKPVASSGTENLNIPEDNVMDSEELGQLKRVDANPEKAFTVWLSKKNRQRAEHIKRTRIRQAKLERTARNQYNLAKDAYHAWILSLDFREEMDQEVEEKMRELALERPPWVP